MLSTLLLRGHMGPATPFDIFFGSLIGLGFLYSWLSGWVDLWKRKRQERQVKKKARRLGVA